MNSLVQEIIKGLLPEAEDKRKVVAVYGGGFKPPTEGHFEVIKQALEENPEIDEFIIFIGTKDRDGLTKADSLLIWEIYNKYLPYKVKIDPSDKSPIQSIYNYAKEHPEEEVLFVIGARENNEEDFKDIALRTRSMDKYPNLELRTIVTKTAASGTAARNAAKVSFEKFRPFLPKELNDEEAREVFDIVSQNIQEELRMLNEVSHHGHAIDYKDKIRQLTDFMRKKGYKIDPLPSIEFIDGDEENASDFFGKTAYYDPNTKTIVLYTEGRHPKDIVRSFSHEMIHHIQNLEGRLGNITTTNTQKDDHLDKLEQEANLKGTMTFRNWTDSLNESKQEPTDSMVLVISDKGHGLNLYDTITKQILGYINVYNNNVTGVAAKKGYGPLMYELGMAHVYPNGLQSDRNGNTEPEAEAVLNKFIAGNSPNIKAVKLTPNDKDYKTEYPNGNKLWDVNNFFNYKFFNPNKSTLEKLISNGDKLSPEEQENIRKLGYNFYDGAVNEAVVGDKIICDNCGWSWNIKDGGDDLYICHKCGHDNTPIKENKNKDPFGINAYAMELARLDEEEGKYKVYLDMDGVIADFDQRFRSLSGMEPKEFEEKYGRNKFWDFIDEENKLKFWIGIPVMPGAKELVDYVKPYDYEILSAPSMKKQSRLGKLLWIKNHTGDVFGSKPNVIFKQAKEKHLVKPELSKYDILVDDRADTIDRWNAAGGTGVLYKSAGQTINALRKIGL
jgi:hypothetical protein